MCQEHSNRIAAGGTIAVLKSMTGPEPDVDLFLSMSGPNTIASLRSSSPEAECCSSAIDIHIHRDGDLRSMLNTESMLHSFTLSTMNTKEAPLPVKIDLGVGGEGVIGRRVRMVHRGSHGETVVRQGIIGWN